MSTAGDRASGRTGRARRRPAPGSGDATSAPRKDSGRRGDRASGVPPVDRAMPAPLVDPGQVAAVGVHDTYDSEY